jgi:DNA-binding response OmpR family regulator
MSSSSSKERKFMGSKAVVLLVGRTGSKEDTPFESLNKRYHLLVASSGKQALPLVKQYPPQAIVLDAVSMRTPGDRICKSLRDQFPTLPIIHIHPGQTQEGESMADVLIVPPFTARKLINSLERLIKSSGDEIIHCGPFTMNVPRRVLVAYGQETQLNPKLASLVELFLRHPNETLDRKKLMEAIWQTDYLGDTRTLDVHIRWVRQALENAGEHPRRLNTVRGIGYRLDVPESAAIVTGLAATAAAAGQPKAGLNNHHAQPTHHTQPAPHPRNKKPINK